MTVPTHCGCEMLMNDKPLGYNNLVISVDVTSKIDNKNIRKYIHDSNLFIEEIDPRGVFLVRKEFSDILDKNKIRYHILGKFPMPRTVREEIRRDLKKRGVIGPI
jgi:hypothetical protein